MVSVIKVWSLKGQLLDRQAITSAQLLSQLLQTTNTINTNPQTQTTLRQSDIHDSSWFYPTLLSNLISSLVILGMLSCPWSHIIIFLFMFLWNGRIQSWLCSVCIPNFSKKFIRKISIDLKFLSPIDDHGVIRSFPPNFSPRARICLFSVFVICDAINFCPSLVISTALTDFANTDNYRYCCCSIPQHIPHFLFFFFLSVLMTYNLYCDFRGTRIGQ